MRNYKTKNLGYLLLVSGIIIYISFNFIAELKTDQIVLLLLIKGIIPIILIILGLLILTNRYLQNRKFENDNKNNIETPLLYELRKFLDTSKEKQNKINNNLESLVNDLKNKVQSYEELSINQQNKNLIIDEFKSSIIQNLNNEFYNELRVNISNNITNKQFENHKNLIEIQNRVIQRLSSEIIQVKKNGRVNFYYGLLFAIAGLFYLFFIITTGGKLTNHIDTKFYTHYSLLILLEILAFFFLRLYRNSFIESKYFQNELSTLELKFYAMNASIYHGTNSDINESIINLSRTERNMTLKKDESTVELKKLEIENNYLSRINDIITTLKKNVK